MNYGTGIIRFRKLSELRRKKEVVRSTHLQSSLHYFGRPNKLDGMYQVLVVLSGRISEKDRLTDQDIAGDSSSCALVATSAIVEVSRNTSVLVAPFANNQSPL